MLKENEINMEEPKKPVRRVKPIIIKLTREQKITLKKQMTKVTKGEITMPIFVPKSKSLKRKQEDK